MSGLASYRRVVTGLNAEGKSCIVIDGEVPLTSPATALVWCTDTIPADNSGTADVEHGRDAFEVMHRSASTFLIAEYAADLEPLWHATDTIDYLVVLKGELVLQLETGEAHLRPGDFVVDRGINHSWRVVGGEPAVAAVVNLPAHPVGKGRTV